MLGKICAGPKGGASSSGLAAYLVGYAVAGKGASREEIAAAIVAVELEAEVREDRGVGRIWSPEAGHGTRPSSILVRGCESYATAAMEIDADAAISKGVEHSALHFVWSFPTSESNHLTDEQVLQFAQESMEKVGLGEHRAILVVHRDTIVRDPKSGVVIDGNVHVHAAVGAVHPVTGIAYDQKGLYRRLARADREIEQAYGLEYQRGLYVIRDAHTPQEHIEEATGEELAAWRRERREERLVGMERRSSEAYRKRDQDFGRFADATIAPRLRTSMDLARSRGREPDWATEHAVAARYGCEIQQDDEGRVILRDVGVGELRLAHSKIERRAERGMDAAGAEREDIDAALAAMRSEHQKSQTAERDRKRKEGDIVGLDSILGDDRSDMLAFQTEEQAEHAFNEAVEADPSLILREITSQQSTFSRSDVDAALGWRIADPEALQRLSDLVVGHESVRALEANTRYPLLTTTEILAIEDRLHDDARELASRESGITVTQVAAAIERFEKSQKEGFRLSDEQRAALVMLERGSLVTIEGLPGTGKTTVMSAVRELAEAEGREIVGLTLSQAAAERLESEAGFRCVNTARAHIMEEANEKVIPMRGVVVVDEAGMVDSRAMARIVALAKERESIVVAIGDTRQLQPIDAGASFRILREAARKRNAYTELRDVQRQRRTWHRESVIDLADAIVEKDDHKRLALVKSSLQRLEKNGAITWVGTRDEAIDRAVTSARTYRAAGLQDTLLLAADKDTVRHLSEEDRRRDGREGAGRTYKTEGGLRELAAADRFVFLENSLSGKRALGVRNGDTGTVVSAEGKRIAVRLDREDRVVEFSPRSYKAWDHANSCSVHRSQGASVGAGVALLDRSASAELAFVALSRSKSALDIVVSQESFADLDDLANHISQRISLKSTTRTYDEEIARTGGLDNIWARKIQRAEEQHSNPLRQQWQSEIVEPMLAARRERLRESSEALRVARHENGGGRGGLGNRLERDRELLRQAKGRNATIIAETTAPRFRTCAKEQEAAQDRIHEAQRIRRQQREVTRRRDRSARAMIGERDVLSSHELEQER